MAASIFEAPPDLGTRIITNDTETKQHGICSHTLLVSVMDSVLV